jgi:glutathione synthase/RimK-type ligase-like ATP-grasp enzyme
VLGAGLSDRDAIPFRTDPPVDHPYLDATLILDLVSPASTLMVSDARGTRAANEKLWALKLPDLWPPTLVGSGVLRAGDMSRPVPLCMIGAMPTYVAGLALSLAAVLVR